MIAIQTISLTWRKLIKTLFKPFRMKFWLKLGLVLWIMQIFLQRGGGGLNSIANIPANISSIDKADFSRIWTLVSPYHPLIITAGGIIVFISIAIFFVFMWLKAVFSFIFLDAAVNDEVRIGRAFSENVKNATSYFLWNIVFTLILTVSFIVLLVSVISFSYFVKVNFLIIFLGVVLGLFFVLLGGVIQTIVVDFILPIMYGEKKGIIRAWKRFFPLFKKYIGEVLIYLLLKWGMAILAGIVLAMVSSGLYFHLGIAWLAGILLNPLTLIGTILFAIPLFLALGYVWQVLFLPVPMFFRIYPLVFLGKCDEELALLPED